MNCQIRAVLILAAGVLAMAGGLAYNLLVIRAFWRYLFQ